jgi:hypothetical protein
MRLQDFEEAVFKYSGTISDCFCDFMHFVKRLQKAIEIKEISLNSDTTALNTELKYENTGWYIKCLHMYLFVKITPCYLEHILNFAGDCTSL